MGGVFVLSGYVIRVGSRTLDVVSGADKAQGIVAAEATGVTKGLRAKWGGGHLRNRPSVHRMGSGWVVDANAASPMSSGFGSYVPRFS